MLKEGNQEEGLKVYDSNEHKGIIEKREYLECLKINQKQIAKSQKQIIKILEQQEKLIKKL